MRERLITKNVPNYSRPESCVTWRMEGTVMSENQLSRAGGWADDDYREFARKMELFENGPTTTNFAQLIAHGIQLPDPDSISDADISAKLWEVIAGLSTLRVYLNQTDHLSDRHLYATLWRDVLRADVPAIDEIGFNTHVGLVSEGSEEQTQLYLRYYADEDARKVWAKDSSECDLPPHEDPPYHRDLLLPRPSHEHGPEALEWLRANPNPSPLATNRFSARDEAVTFVEALYAAGATNVVIGNILMLPNDRWAPYADMLLVDLPGDPAQRREMFELVDKIGRPDGDDAPLIEGGQSTIRLWWD